MAGIVFCFHCFSFHLDFFVLVVVEGEIFLFTGQPKSMVVACQHAVVGLTELLGDIFNLEVPLLLFFI